MKKCTGENHAIIIGFPQLYPDELLYSGCARFSDYRRYPNRRHVLEELFGNPRQSTVVDLPNRLLYLVEHLPPEYGYTVDQFIYHHTLYPFYAPFLPPERRRQLYDFMCGNDGRKTPVRTNIKKNDVSKPEYMRFCPACVVFDRERYGETYWHLSHQLPSITVCAQHGVFLEESKVNFRGRLDWRFSEFISAEQGVHKEPARFINTVQYNDQNLLKLAKNASWLLTNYGVVFDYDYYIRRYRSVLKEYGYISNQNRLKSGDLLRDFVDYYTVDTLKALRCFFELTDNKPWPQQLIQKHDGKTFHPLYHLLFVQFLGHSMESILVPSPEPEPFGTGPWLCLNRFCEYYQQEVIEQYSIRHRTRDKEIEGAFECSCGFSYACISNTDAALNKSEYSRVISYGDVWIGEFIQLWNNPEISLESISRIVGVTANTLRNFAAQLQLSFSHRSAQYPKQVRVSSQLIFRNSGGDDYRQEVLEAQKENPDITRTDLWHHHLTAMTWLQHNDRDWLDECFPHKVNRFISYTRPPCDWATRDQEIAAKVREAAKMILDLSGKPLRITRASLSRHMNQEHGKLLQWYSGSAAEHLPLTHAALEEVVDTTISWALKRIEWVKEECLRGNVVAKRSVLYTYGCINSCIHIPEVKEAFEQALAELQQRACD